ncbi:MAG TPA: transglutaminase domain-containing protein, partial [Blastocatellia bacterium]
TLFSPDDLKQFASVWAMDFEKEILSELGPECGLALLGLPGYNGEEFDAPWIIFFKLKSEKVSRALSEGKLIKGVAAGTPAPRIKLAGVDVALTVKNGHLIIAGRETTLARLDAKERLDSARDFARAAKAAPAGVVAFGGYNHEAAIAEIKIPSNDPAMAQVASAMLSVARAFHSQNFYATTNAGQLDARMSVSLDLGGRYPVQDISRHKDYRLTFAVIEAGGIPIVDQKSLESLKLRIRTKTQGAIDSIKQDIAMANQEADKRSEEEIVLTMRPRRFAKPGKIQLPISGAEFADFLKPTHDIRSDDKSIIERARAIVGDDRDAWSVARKLSDWTYKNLKWKRVDYADAAQTLATREADCTEFSELFVAMARSLGLPARMVTGFAHSSGSFGGHAWVEVYAGEWVELDPTFGTDFVDATHIRESSNELIGYAALSLVQIDTLEAVRGVFEFQRDAKTLAEKLCEELPTGEQNALTASLDLAALADEYVGTGAWDKMSERERAQMSAAYRKVLAEMASKFSADEEDGEGMRLLKLTKTGDRAEAIVIGYSDDEEMLMRFKLARRGDAWRLTEIVEVDTGLQLISSMLQPAAQGILDRRSGKTASKPQAALEQELLALTDFAAAIELVDKALKDEPKNRNLRFIKALALSANDKQEETVKLLNELSGEEPPLARAVYLLAARYQGSEQAEDHKRAIELFERYVALEPDDPRPLSALAALYQQAGDAPRAEAKYLAAIDRDPQHADRHIDLAQFLISVHRYPEALAALDKGESPLNTKDQLYTALLARYSYAEDYATAEALVAAHPERLAKNFDAIMMLARIRMESGNAKEALPLLKKANQLKPESAEAHTSMADAYRKLKNWPAALAAADTALRIDGENFLAFYHRACALARLGRKQEAMLALKRAAEMLESISISHFIEDEEDLRPLAGLAEFKQLLKKKDEK